MSMSEQEWLEVLAMKRTSRSREKKTRTCLSLLAPLVCAAALVPSVYILVKTIESLPRLSFTQDRPSDHLDFR